MAGTKVGMETGREAVAFEEVKKDITTLSVLIASYQSGEKLYEAVKSALDQSCSEIEIVVCDDGSGDFDENQLRALGKDKNIKICRHETNVGTVRNLNGGLHLCEGQWILLLAADDVLAGNDVASKLMMRAEKTKKEWIVGPAMLCREDFFPTGQISPTNAQLTLLRNGDVCEIWSYLCQACFIPSCGTLYRRELLQRQGGFDESYCLVEDWPLFLKLIREGNLPEVMDMPVTLHRAGGVSQKAAGRNQVYQRDMLKTMRQEILPYTSMLGEKEKKEIETLCLDKEAIYQLRFEMPNPGLKISWLLAHSDVVMRKIIERGRKQYRDSKL